MDKGTIVLGLTGSIGMGKTTVAVQLEEQGAKICSADAIVHGLLAKDGQAVVEVGKAFPETLHGGAIDRGLLGAAVFGDKQKLQTLEHILHPMVVAVENAFIEQQRRDGVRVVVLEIPLLYETGAESRCDKVAVVSAPYFIQRARVLKRQGMTEEKFQRILALQMPDAEKCRRADFIVQTGLGWHYSFWQVKRIMRMLHA